MSLTSVVVICPMLRLKLLLDLRLFRGQPTSTPPPAWSASIPLAISSSLRAAASGSVNLLGATNFMGSAYHDPPHREPSRAGHRLPIGNSGGHQRPSCRKLGR